MFNNNHSRDYLMLHVLLSHQLMIFEDPKYTIYSLVHDKHPSHRSVQMNCFDDIGLTDILFYIG